MKEGWKSLTLSACIEKIQPTSKIPSSLYQKDGKYPIVSQEKEFISGYWDNAEDLFTHNIPVTIFGDHTTVVKYIDFNFIIGADGVKILLPKSFLHPKYFFYCVSSIKIASHGYARHYRYLKESIISYPTSLSEQQRIVEILDAEFAKIDALKANAEKSLQAAKDLFQSALKQTLEPKSDWIETTLAGIAELKGGKRVPKGYKLEKESTGYPYIRVADFNDNGSINMDDIHYINETVYNSIKRYIITTDDVYISIAGTIGKSGIIPKELNGANLTENACRLVFKKNNINPQYIYFCTISPAFKEQIAKLTMKAAQPKLALTRLGTVKLNIPPQKEQQDKIATILTNLDERCKALQENYRKTIALCEDLKQALLRKAFNGEL